MGMKILLTNQILGGLTGSEQYQYTLYKELSKKHEVEMLYEIPNGELLANYPVIKRGQLVKYDLAIISHHQFLNVLAKKKVFISHSSIKGVETPRKGADAYVAVADHIGMDYSEFDMTVIGQPIDCEKYNFTKPPNKELKVIASMSNYPHVHEGIEHVCKDLGLEHIKIRQEKNPLEKILKADLVVALGRSHLEAMACGKCVLNWDVRDYQGSLGEGITHRHDLIAKKNYSGRWFKNKFDESMIKEELKKYYYDPINQRAYVLKYHDVKKIAKQLCNLV